MSSDIVGTETARGLAETYMSESKLLQVATSTADDMGFAHVWFAHDEQLNLFFASNTARIHSGQIRESGRVSFGIVAIELDGLGQKVRGIMGTGSATELSGARLTHGYAVYSAKWPNALTAFPLEKMESDELPMRIYEIVPSSLVLWDEVNSPSAPRLRVI